MSMVVCSGVFLCYLWLAPASSLCALLVWVCKSTSVAGGRLSRVSVLQKSQRVRPPAPMARGDTQVMPEFVRAFVQLLPPPYVSIWGIPVYSSTIIRLPAAFPWCVLACGRKYGGPRRWALCPHEWCAHVDLSILRHQQHGYCEGLRSALRLGQMIIVVSQANICVEGERRVPRTLLWNALRGSLPELAHYSPRANGGQRSPRLCPDSFGLSTLRWCWGWAVSALAAVCIWVVVVCWCMQSNCLPHVVFG